LSDITAFAVTKKWPPQHPDRLQLYSVPTPNGVKVSIMLEEIGLPYEPHRVDFEKKEQLSREFLSISPNNKIPAILDPDGPRGKPLALFESGAILMYLAEKTGQLLGAPLALRAFPRGRYVAEARRLLAVLEGRLADRTWILGDEYTIADIATFPWVRNLIGFYEAGELVGIGNFPKVTAALERFLARPAVKRGLAIPPKG
jgi:GST-like protein